METQGNLRVVLGNEVDAKAFNKVFSASPYNSRKEDTAKPYAYLYLPTPGTGNMKLVVNILDKADYAVIADTINEALRQAKESCDLNPSIQGTAVVLDDNDTVTALFVGCGLDLVMVPLQDFLSKTSNCRDAILDLNNFILEQIWRYQPLFVKCPKCGEEFIPDATMEPDGGSKVIVPTGINKKENQLELLWTQADIDANFVYKCPACEEIVAYTTEDLKKIRLRENE